MHHQQNPTNSELVVCRKRSADKMSTDRSDVGIPVKVALKIRPLINREMIAGCKEILENTSNQNQVQLGQHLFTFDHVFTAASRHEDVFNGAVEELLNKGLFCGGCNVTIFAYGQTGSGKTYTLGLSNIGGEAMPDGIVLRALDYLFGLIDANGQSTEFKMTLSILEIYQEKLRDLVSSTNNRSVEIREEFGKIRLNGLSEHRVASVHDCVQLFAKAAMNRTVGETKMNAESSRSHAIYTLTMKRWTRSEDSDLDKTLIDLGSEAKKSKLESSNDDLFTVSKLQIVDLAGSERCARTKTVGNRFQEGIKINMGLLALGNVISLLGDEGTCHRHIPYRDSKLTRILQDSLGGNSLTLMVACVSPSSDSSEETLNTLRYANRARNIKNKPISNRELRKGRKIELLAEIDDLKRKLIDCESEPCPLPDEIGSDWSDVMQLKDLFDSTKQFLEDARLSRKDGGVEKEYEVIRGYLDRTLERIIGEEANSTNDYSILRTCLANNDDDDDDDDVIDDGQQSDDDEGSESDGDDMIVVMCVQRLIDCVLADEEIGEIGVPSDVRFSSDSITRATSRKIVKLNDLLRDKQHLLDQYANDKLAADRNVFDATHRMLNDQIRVLELRKSDKSENDGVKSAEMEKLEDEIKKYKFRLDEIKLKIAENERVREAYRLLKSEIQELKQERVLLVRELRRFVGEIRKIRLDTERRKGRLRIESVRRRTQLNTLRMEKNRRELIIDKKNNEITSTFMKLRAILDRKKQQEREMIEKIKEQENTPVARNLCECFDRKIEHFVRVAHANQKLEELWKSRQTLNDRLLSANSEANDVSKSILDQLEQCSDEIMSQQELVDKSGDMDERICRVLDRLKGLRESQIVFKHVFTGLSDKIIDQRNLVERNNQTDCELTALRQQNDETRAQREEIECRCKTMMSEMTQKLMAKSIEKPEILEKALICAIGIDGEQNETDARSTLSQSRTNILNHSLKAVRKLIRYRERDKTEPKCDSSELRPFGERICKELLNTRLDFSTLGDRSNFSGDNQLDQGFMELNSLNNKPKSTEPSSTLGNLPE